MRFKLKNSLIISALLATGVMATTNAQAAGTITFGEDKYISVGFGSIAGYNSTEDAAANGNDRSNDFSMNSARIYISGSMNKYIKGMLNTESSGTGGATEVIDANVQFQLTDDIAIWAGRFLSPSDRANMAGPYYSMGGGYWANVASRYGWNGGTIGRDDGVALVGSAMDGKVGYSFGAFEGDRIFRFSPAAALSETSGNKDKLMYAGRLQVDFWDAEPGYYGTGNYFGAKDILAIGIAGRQKTDGVVKIGAVGDYKAYSVDFLLEKKDVGPGTFSAEAAYYDYDTDDVFLSEQGKAYSAGMGYLFNSKVGWGQFMPFVRYQKFDSDANTTFKASGAVDLAGETKRYEIGTNYIIAPYNALITATYSDTKISGASSANAFNVALQFQF
ncbi:MAG: porin [Methylotenera sp.]|nr:porin [Methylotenera sp.]MDO9390129.1 porin [Methylotenera sp.]MDP2101830.1 porin [Methylotenera sp.]MDP2281453.1 porin [Methylotenera sp.]MDP3060172.1 porin [Methylotenera sp.]